MTRILLNDERRNHGQVLKNWFSGSTDAFVAVAFLKQTGWRIIEEEVRKFLERGGAIRLLVGTDFHLTDPAALRRLHALSQQHPKLEWRMVEASAGSTYHPKYYRCRADSAVWVMTGSANLTAGGLSQNIETSVMLEDSVESRFFQECEKTEAALWNHPRSLAPNEEMIGRYAAQHSRTKRLAKKAEELVETETELAAKLESELLTSKLEAYLADSNQQADLVSRRANYLEANRLVKELLDRSHSISEEDFRAAFDNLVGSQGGQKLWHSNGLYRQRTQVMEQWPEVLKMFCAIGEVFEQSPAAVYAVGLHWIERIRGVGPNILTEFCHTLSPRRLSPLNNNPVDSLRWLGIEDFPKPDAFKPEDYARFCSCMDRLRMRAGFSDLGEADHFLNYIYWEHAKADQNRAEEGESPEDERMNP